MKLAYLGVTDGAEGDVEKPKNDSDCIPATPDKDCKVRRVKRHESLTLNDGAVGTNPVRKIVQNNEKGGSSR